MKRTLLVGLGLLCFIVGAALASPARITLFFPAKAAGLVPTRADRIVRVQAVLDELATGIGERNDGRPEALFAAQSWVSAELQNAGLTLTSMRVNDVASTIIAERGPADGRPVVIVGAHLDTAPGTPGADDNASGIAVLLELARNPAVGSGATQVRYVVFAHEEPPFFQTAEMGSRQYAQSLAGVAGSIKAMYSIESVGFYSDESGSQRWPLALGVVLPRTGNFVMLVTNPNSSRLLQDSLMRFRAASTLPAAGASVPGAIPGVDWSDHAEFWRVDIPAIMVTDTPPLRNPNYHRPSDLPATVSAAKIAAVADGMEGVLAGFNKE